MTAPHPTPSNLSPFIQQAAVETQLQIAPEPSTTIDYAALLQQLSIDLTADISEPPICLSISSAETTSTIGTLGNVSVVTGKAKSRKTFFVGTIVASLLQTKPLLERIKGHLAPDRNVVLYFDTEQSNYHLQRSLKRICAQSGLDNPANLRGYGLRSKPTELRRELIEWAIYNTPDVAFVVIDGIRDCVFDINSPEEATATATRLLRWTDERQIHILTIIHQNKGDQNARGHLGAELVNKAETVMSVTMDSSNKAISTVAAEYCRDMYFEPFSFSINEDGLPYFVDEYGNAASQKPGKERYKSSELTNEEIEQIFIRAFGKDETLQRGTLQINVQEASDFIGKRLANNRAVELIARSTANGYLQKEQPPKGYPVYRLNPDKRPLQ